MNFKIKVSIFKGSKKVSVSLAQNQRLNHIWNTDFHGSNADYRGYL